MRRCSRHSTPPLLSARYNVAPSQVIAVVGLKQDGKRRGIALLRWGLVAHWANGPNEGPRPINVRAESIRYKFGDIFREKRCLIPADGFYEWVRRESCSCDCLTVGDQTCRPIGSTLRGRRHPETGRPKSPRTMKPSAVRPPHRPRGACGPASTTAGRG